MRTAPELSCPRCGYDVSGVVPTWKEVCPLDGTCSECGLEFAWVDQFRPDRNSVPGFVEHSRGFFRTIVAAWRTWMWTIWPRVFFTRVGVNTPMRPWRSVAYLLIIFGTLHVAASLAGSVGRFEWNPYQFSPGGGPWESTLDAISVWTYPWLQVSEGIGGRLWPPWIEFMKWRDAHSLVAFAVLLHTLLAATIAVIPSKSNQTPIRASQIARAWVYGLSWLVWLGVFRLGRNVWLLWEWLYSKFVFSNRGVRVVTIHDFPDSVALIASLAMLAWIGLWWHSAYVIGWQAVGRRRVRRGFLFALIAALAFFGAMLVMNAAVKLIEWFGDR